MTRTSVLQVMQDLRHAILLSKEVFTLDEFCAYTGYEKSYAYKLVNARKIPYHKPPGGKSLFFKKDDVINYITAIRVPSIDEVKENAAKQLKAK